MKEVMHVVTSGFLVINSELPTVIMSCHLIQDHAPWGLTAVLAGLLKHKAKLLVGICPVWSLKFQHDTKTPCSRHRTGCSGEVS